MSGDRSLDEFLGPGSDGEGDSDVGEANSDPEPKTTSLDVEEARDEPEPADDREPDADPLATTYAWSADGQCTVCGTAASARWRDDGEFVCVDCKDW